jgi:hypothetical protein
MRPALLLLAVLALPGCGGGGSASEAGLAGSTPTAAAGYSADVRKNFLTSCLQNATNTASGAATEEQLTQTCECILGQVEAEYSETEFAEFEKRLLAGEAEAAERDRLVGWSTGCAKETTG